MSRELYDACKARVCHLLLERDLTLGELQSRVGGKVRPALEQVLRDLIAARDVKQRRIPTDWNRYGDARKWRVEYALYTEAEKAYEMTREERDEHLRRKYGG